jgi:hypothetical protein
MSISGISNSKVSFSGIYGTATKVNPDGSKTSFAINLPEDGASLGIDNGNSKDTSPKDQVRLMVLGEKSKKGHLESSNIRYENVKIGQVDGNSTLNITAYGQYPIGTMKDNAALSLGKGRIGSAWAEIGKIEGKNVKISLRKGSMVDIEDQSRFKLWSENISSNKFEYADISGKNLNIKG